jgi:pimeloyl-ACP methyl ester carboxylesterase
MSPSPFRQLRFEDLPAKPRLPHGWARTEARTVVVGGLPARVYAAGQGPPLLLVHGLMTAAWSWRYVAEAFAADFTVYMPDLPGAGDTPPLPRATPEALVAWLEDLAGALDLRGAPVVGNSLGGYLCMRWALAHPASVGRLSVLHAPGVPTPRLWALKAAMSLPGADGLLWRLVSRDPERWVHRNVHYYDESLKSREETAVWAAPLRNRAGCDAFASWLRDACDPASMRGFVADLRTLNGRFPVPLQLVYAEEDPMVPPVVGERLAALLPEASYVRLQRASHFAHVDAPEAWLAAVGPFLAQGSARTST